MFEPRVGSIAVKTIDNFWPMKVARRVGDGWVNDRGERLPDWETLLSQGYDLIREGWV